jgi:ribonuclease BN (tRNA processing enzyme)
MELTFLGVGAALPAPGGTNSSYLLRAAGATLLIDCGPAILQQLGRAGLSPGDVTHVFITHRHGDHALGYPMFLLWWALTGRHASPPTVVASSATWQSLRALWDHSYGDLPPFPVCDMELPAEAPSSHPLTPEITLHTWPMAHSSFAPVLGVRVEVGGKVLAFTGDTARCSSIVELARDADLLVHDANHAATVEPMVPEGSPFHATARDAGQHATQAGARNLALVHIGAEYDGRQGDLVQEARSAFAGHVFSPQAGDVFRL